jgi:hypothetical protein
MATYKLDPRNARRHPEQNKRAVEASLKELGAAVQSSLTLMG